MSELSPDAILDGIKIFEEFKGALTEQFVLSELAGMDFIRGIYYWNSEATAEIDFVFADDREIYPVEVKARENLRSRSLRVYRERYHPNLAIRASLSNIKLDNGLLNIPLFALFNLENYLSESQ
jgi:predicted AAA+ superfamily ATPase